MKRDQRGIAAAQKARWAKWKAEKKKAAKLVEERPSKK